MTGLIRRSSRGLVALIAIAASLAHAALDADATRRLDSLQVHPTSVGDRVYTGQVRALGQGSGPNLFSYKRRVTPTLQGWMASHITFDPGGTVVIVEQAEVDSRYALHRFEAINRQTGQSGSVTASNDGRQLTYRLVDNGVSRTATEVVTAPVVSGPSLHGFILAHWETLVQGQNIHLRFVVLAEMRTYGFDLALATRDDGRLRFSVTPSSWWVRLAVAPLTVSFDEGSRRLIRYEGRVPPAVLEDGRWRALDAQVDYTMAIPVYR